MIGTDQALELMKASSPMLRYNGQMDEDCRWIAELYGDDDRKQYKYGATVSMVVQEAFGYWLYCTADGQQYRQEQAMKNEPLPLGTKVLVNVSNLYEFGDEDNLTVRARICGYRVNATGTAYQIELDSGRTPEEWFTTEAFMEINPNGE